MSAVLRVENLSKVYRLGELNRSVFLQDLRRRLRGDFSELDETATNLFWALRDVTFQVQDGEVLGLLGHNGAGKSTLLKVLARITAPSRGWVGLRGRVASLLEVGTGFHLEMTGRENVFLNGTILGMNRREVQSKFDEIVAFSGVEEFLDSPVKHYSVGMRVRLAFAVAAHLEPEILLVDEVLAVGDAAFQKKCLGKIGEVSRSGRTVIMVSHNAAAIESLCTRGILLEKGRMVFDGTAEDALEAHAASRAALSRQLRDRVADRMGSGAVKIVGLRLQGPDGSSLATPRSGQPLEIALQYEKNTAAEFPRLAAQITVQTHLGVPVFTQSSWLTGDIFGQLPASGELVCSIPELPLAPGHYLLNYRITAELRGGVLLDALDTAGDLHVEAGNFYGSGMLPGPTDGVSLVAGAWRLERPQA